MIEVVLSIVFLVIGLVAGAKWQQNVFTAEKLAAEETARLVEMAKKRTSRKKNTTPAA